MNWYLAKIVYRIICGDGHHTAQFDEQLRLIAAQHEEEALTKASTIGRQEEEVFYNDRQQLVQWKFIDVAELHTLNDLIDGAELYSQIKETGDPEPTVVLSNTSAAYCGKNIYNKPFKLLN